MGFWRSADFQIRNFQIQLHAIQAKHLSKVTVINNGESVKAVNAGSNCLSFNIRKPADGDKIADVTTLAGKLFACGFHITHGETKLLAHLAQSRTCCDYGWQPLVPGSIIKLARGIFKAARMKAARSRNPSSDDGSGSKTSAPV